jgi:hypothetical protein
VLDAFAALVAAKAKDLATEMTSYEVWPRDNGWGRTKAMELMAAATDAPTATIAETTTDATTGTTTDDRTKESPGKKAKAKKTKKKDGKAKKRGGRRRR